MTFKDFFQDLKLNFQDFPGPNWFSRTVQVLEFSRKKSGTFHEAWEPCSTMTDRAFYDIRPGNGADLFLQPWSPRTAQKHQVGKSWPHMVERWLVLGSLACILAITSLSATHGQCDGVLMITFPGAEHCRSLTSVKSYCSVTKVTESLLESQTDGTSHVDLEFSGLTTTSMSHTSFPPSV